MRRVFITGGAGFIGSHFIHRLLADEQTEQITVYDRKDDPKRFVDPRLRYVLAARDHELDVLAGLIRDHDTMVHLAANSDISAAESNPSIDFENGTVLTHSVLEAMRITGVKRLIYMSSGSVYGELNGRTRFLETDRLTPLAPYAASKVAGEAMISAYRHMFGIHAWIFRPSNVVGKWMTRGVTYDLIGRLLVDPTQTHVLGDGWQSKNYIPVEDVVTACLMAAGQDSHYDAFNVAGEDSLTVRDIVEIVLETMGLTATVVTYGRRRGGWRGDVPVTRFAAARLRSLGWRPSMSSYEAVESAARAILEERRELVR